MLKTAIESSGLPVCSKNLVGHVLHLGADPSESRPEFFLVQLNITHNYFQTLRIGLKFVVAEQIPIQSSTVIRVRDSTIARIPK